MSKLMKFLIPYTDFPNVPESFLIVIKVFF